MDWYEPEVRDLEAARTRAVIPRCPAVFYGSSTIRLWTTLACDLESPRAVNLGFGGSTLAACAHFFERLVVPLDPASLTLYAGDNDLGDGRSPEDVLASFRDLAAQAARRLKGVPFGFISIKPSPARANLLDAIRRANQYVRSEIALHPSAYYIDVFSAMLSPAGRPRPELFLADGLHLGPEGYRLWTQLLSPFRNRILTGNCHGIHGRIISSE